MVLSCPNGPEVKSILDNLIVWTALQLQHGGYLLLQLLASVRRAPLTPNTGS